MKKRMFATLALVGATALTIAGCSSGDDPTSGNTANAGGNGGGDLITVGFAQTGSESGWRREPSRAQVCDTPRQIPP